MGLGGSRERREENGIGGEKRMESEGGSCSSGDILGYDGGAALGVFGQVW